MATTSKATQPKKTTRPAKAAEPEASAAESQIKNLEAQVATLTAQVANLSSAVQGKDIDGDGIPDIAGLTARVDNIVRFLTRRHGEGPMENSGVK
jgi:hypothetical protein